MIIDSRAVSKQLIAQSFRGILRISPNNNIDGGLSTELSPVSDSIGNLSPLSLSTERVKINSPLEIDHLTSENNMINIDSPANFNSSLFVKNVEIDTDNTNNGNILIAENNKYISKNLLEHLANVLVPVGTIIAYAGLKNPTGWLVCDGSEITRADYPALYDLLSKLPSDDDKVRLPNLRNKFIRGYDKDDTRDFGSTQLSAAPNITGWFDGNTDDDWFGGRKGGAFYTEGPGLIGCNGTGYGAFVKFDASRCSTVYQEVDEVRPININLNYIIKT